MKILSRNINTNRPFKFFELLGVFCVLLISISVFLQSGNFKFGTNEFGNHPFKSNQRNTGHNLLHVSNTSHLSSYLLTINSVEESEPKDENTEEKALESGFSLQIHSFFNYNILTSSFANFSLSLQKRISIPFFLLHHSWKIPAA